MFLLVYTYAYVWEWEAYWWAATGPVIQHFVDKIHVL